MESSTCTMNNATWTSREDIVADILKAKKELQASLDSPPLIEVWRGDQDWMRKTDYPLIREDKNIPEDDYYIVAGVGVIAGKKANQRLWELGYMAVWSENPPPILN